LLAVRVCGSETLVSYLICDLVSFHFIWEIEQFVAPALLLPSATRVRLPMLIGWHQNRVIWQLRLFLSVALWASLVEKLSHCVVCLLSHCVVCWVTALLPAWSAFQLHTSLVKFVCWNGWTVLPSHQDRWDSSVSRSLSATQILLL